MALPRVNAHPPSHTLDWRSGTTRSSLTCSGTLSTVPPTFARNTMTARPDFPDHDPRYPKRPLIGGLFQVADCQADAIFDLTELIEDSEEAFAEFRLQDGVEAAAEALRATNKCHPFLLHRVCGSHTCLGVSEAATWIRQIHHRHGAVEDEK